MKKEKKKKYWYFCTGEKDLHKFLFAGFLYASSIDFAYTAIVGELTKRDKFSLDKLSIQVDEGV